MKRKSRKPSGQPNFQPDPHLALEEYRPLLEPGEYDQLAQEIDEPLLPSIRLNPFKTDREFPEFLQNKYGWILEPIPFCQSGYRVSIRNGIEVSEALEHKLGMFYIQEAASMLPVELFSTFHKEDLCLDLAASPGGKTTHLVSRLGDQGLVLANDSSQGRISALRIVLQNWGAVSCAVTRFPGESYGVWYPEVFDRVLLDAPCSMQGLRVSDSHALRPVTEKESTQLSIRQTALLVSALQSVKVGGEVVYSTCTLLPAEDEGVIDNILRRFKSSVRLLDAQVILPKPAPGILGDGNQSYSPGMEKTIRLWPHRYHTAGFFACILQKTASFNLPTSLAPSHDMEKAGFYELNSKESSTYCHEFLNQYGYNLSSYLDSDQRIMIRRDQKVYLFPSLLMDQFRNLPLQSAGLLLGELTPDGFLPSHEWVSRFGRECQHQTITLDNANALEWLSGRNLENQLQPNINGKYLIVMNEDRQVLGRGKVAGSVIKNMLPRRLI